MLKTPKGGKAPSALLLLAGALVSVTTVGHAQVGTVSPLPYSGWIPSDRVAPVFTSDISYDEVAGLWHYRYTVANGADAEQEIKNVVLRMSGPPSAAAAPNGWWAVKALAEAYSVADPADVAFDAELPDATLELGYWPASAFQIPPGRSLSGFALASPYGPGNVRTFVQGYARMPLPPQPDSPEFEASTLTPHDSIDSQRGWTLGPTRYEGVVTRGNLNVDGSEGFLGFMNLALTGTVLRSPAPIAIKLSVSGETVFPETFTALLNGVDVTAAFHPGGPGSADLVGLFALGTLPLQTGDNVLITTVEGLIPGTTRRAIDEDLIRFEVQP